MSHERRADSPGQLQYDTAVSTGLTEPDVSDGLPCSPDPDIIFRANTKGKIR